MRKRHGNGQLLPLEQRMTEAEKARRSEKNEYRRLISVEHAKTRGMAVGCMLVLRRGLLGRLKWLMLGR